jgi:type II secretory pathway pseudopilin PulG
VTGRSGGFTALELLIVVSIIVILIGLMIPLIGILKESSRKQQARRVVSQIETGLREYAAEDPTRSMPPQDSDHFIRFAASGMAPRLVNALIDLHLDAGLQTMVDDPADARLRVLVDPWRRPYRYQLDDAGADDPTQKVAPTRPDPARLDWNARNLVPFGYVWSLGPPRQGHAAQWTGDPDAQAGSGAAWIYTTTAPGTTP